jgi:DNA-binding transcriptional LysR family regulator
MATSPSERDANAIGVHMQMHQIRYFLALCEECNFTRAAKRSGISQPSLTNAISALERELGGALFQRKPFIALTALGHAMQPYLRRIAETADHAREAAQAFVRVATPVNAELAELHQPTANPEYTSG